MDIVVDKDGHHSKLDAMSKQQLYFSRIQKFKMDAQYRAFVREAEGPHPDHSLWEYDED